MSIIFLLVIIELTRILFLHSFLTLERKDFPSYLLTLSQKFSVLFSYSRPYHHCLQVNNSLKESSLVSMSAGLYLLVICLHELGSAIC